MKPIAKYAICLLPTLVIGAFIGFYMLLIFSGGGCGHDHGYTPSALPLSWTLALPFWGIAAMLGESAFTTIGLLSALQFPVYAGLIAWAWNKRRLITALTLLALIHFSSYFFAVALYKWFGFAMPQSF